jgi:hypothetical protein
VSEDSRSSIQSGNFASPRMAGVFDLGAVPEPSSAFLGTPAALIAVGSAWRRRHRRRLRVVVLYGLFSFFSAAPALRIARAIELAMISYPV